MADEGRSLSFTADFAVTLLDVPEHRHGAEGTVYVSYDDAVRVAHEVYKRRSGVTADASPKHVVYGDNDECEPDCPHPDHWSDDASSRTSS